MKEKIKELLRSVPVADKTYSEYVDALADMLVKRSVTIPDPSSFKDLSERMRYHMKVCGLNQVQLARRARCTESAISRYLSADRIPVLKTLTRIASALGVSVDYLLNGGDING
jgi:ribosome-binding protein aMBF1 (putative translation factor)